MLDFTLTVSGGVVDKVVFNNVAKHLTYTLMGGEVKAYEISGNNVSGKLILNEQLFSTESLGTAQALFTENGEKVFFIADGQGGSGATFKSPSTSLEDAYAAIGENGGTIVICGPFTVANAFNTSANKGKITFTSVYDGVDYAKTNDAKMIFAANFYCGGDTEFNNITLKANNNYRSIFAATHELVLGENITSLADAATNTYLSVMGGGSSALIDKTTNLTVSSGIWQRVRGGAAADGNMNSTVNLTINGGEFKEMLTLGSTSSHEGTVNATINGGVFRSGIYAATLTKEEHSFNCNVNLTMNGGTFYHCIAPANSTLGTYNGTYNLTINGGDFSHINDIKGTDGITGMTSTLTVSGAFDFDKEFEGTQSFTSLIRDGGADPWVFFHEGFYYYTATAGGSGLRLIKTANLGDILNAASARIYKPEKGHEYSSHIWSPEIHYFSAEEIGEEYAGWYCFIASAPDEAWETANNVIDNSTFGALRGYVIKCLTDDLLGPWGHPVTGEPNVPQKLEFLDTEHNKNGGVMGCSIITINGTKYLMFIDSVGKETQKTDDFNYHQRINIVKFTNPWTVKGEPKVICVPEYDWEKHGSEDKYHPAVVEGATAVYNPNGEIYIIYSASGYFTAHYQLGQLTYIGGENGDPTDINCWEKKATPIFSQSDELRGCGHASYVTDADGQGWICYHAYPKGDDGRSAYIEPYYFADDGIVIGNGSGKPSPLDTVYTVNVNPLPVAKRVSGFDSINVTASTAVKLTIGSTTAYINGAAHTLDAAPINRNNRTMLPVRFLANAFGVSNDGIAWDAQTRTATLKNATTTIVVTIDAPTMTVNGETVALDSPAIIENNRTYLPVRAIANALGVSNDNIAWDAATNTATLTK